MITRKFRLIGAALAGFCLLGFPACAGAYGFKVQSYGIPTGYKDKLKLAAGTQVYLEVQWGGSWLEGVAGGDAFDVRTLSPELGQAYLRTMRYLGPARTSS